MANPILPKHNNTAGVVPSASSLVTNELAINTADAVAYVKHSDGTVKHIVDPTKAPIDSPALTGTPKAPTAPAGTNTTQIATTEFVTNVTNKAFNKTDLRMAIGNINSPLLYMPLRSAFNMLSGVGSATFKRSSSATYIDRYGVLQSAGTDTPRFEKQGYLNEGNGTNLLTYSEQADNSAWTQVNVTVSANATSIVDPYGTNNADKIIEDSSTNLHYISQTVSVSSTSLTFSCFVKAAESTKFRLSSYESSTPASPIVADFDLTSVTATPANPSTVSATITAIANGWFRVTASTKSAAKVSTEFHLQITRSGTGSYAGDGSSGLYVFGAQLETWSFATSYIPTTNSSANRSADVLNVPRAGNFPNIEANGVISILCDIDVFGDTDNNLWIWAFYNTSQDNIGLAVSRMTCFSHATSVNDDTTTPIGAVSPRTTYRVVQVISNAGNYGYLNGIQTGFKADTDGRITTACNSIMSSIRIGSYNSGDTYAPNAFHGHISNFRVYDRALTADEVSIA
jgi:hypothetical protein